TVQHATDVPRRVSAPAGVLGVTWLGAQERLLSTEGRERTDAAGRPSGMSTEAVSVSLLGGAAMWSWLSPTRLNRALTITLRFVSRYCIRPLRAHAVLSMLLRSPELGLYFNLRRHSSGGEASWKIPPCQYE